MLILRPDGSTNASKSNLPHKNSFSSKPGNGFYSGQSWQGSTGGYSWQSGMWQGWQGSTGDSSSGDVVKLGLILTDEEFQEIGDAIRDPDFDWDEGGDRFTKKVTEKLEDSLTKKNFAGPRPGDAVLGGKLKKPAGPRPGDAVLGGLGGAPKRPLKNPMQTKPGKSFGGKGLGKGLGKRLGTLAKGGGALLQILEMLEFGESPTTSGSEEIDYDENGIGFLKPKDGTLELNEMQFAVYPPSPKVWVTDEAICVGAGVGVGYDISVAVCFRREPEQEQEQEQEQEKEGEQKQGNSHGDVDIQEFNEQGRKKMQKLQEQMADGEWAICAFAFGFLESGQTVKPPGNPLLNEWLVPLPEKFEWSAMSQNMSPLRMRWNRISRTWEEQDFDTTKIGGFGAALQVRKQSITFLKSSLQEIAISADPELLQAPSEVEASRYSDGQLNHHQPNSATKKVGPFIGVLRWYSPHGNPQPELKLEQEQELEQKLPPPSRIEEDDDMKCCKQVDQETKRLIRLIARGMGIKKSGLKLKVPKSFPYDKKDLLEVESYADALTQTYKIWPETVGLTPQHDEVKVGANRPQLAIGFGKVTKTSKGEKIEQAKTQLNVPHYRHKESVKPRIPRFTAGPIFVRLILKDNSRLSGYFKSFEEGKKTITALKALVDPRMLDPDEKIERVSSRRKVQIKTVAPVLIKYFPQGHDRPPSWTKSLRK